MLYKQKWSMIDTTGKIISEAAFDEHRNPRSFYNYDINYYYDDNTYPAANYSEDLIGVRNDSTWRFVGKDGKIKVPLIYENVRPFSNGYAAVMQNHKWGFTDAKGKVIIKPQFFSVLDFYGQIAGFQMEEKMANGGL